MKSQVLHTVWCNMTGEATGEIWTWSLLGVKGLMWGITFVVLAERRCPLLVAMESEQSEFKNRMQDDSKEILEHNRIKLPGPRKETSKKSSPSTGGGEGNRGAETEGEWGVKCIARTIARLDDESASPPAEADPAEVTEHRESTDKSVSGNSKKSKGTSAIERKTSNKSCESRGGFTFPPPVAAVIYSHKKLECDLRETMAKCSRNARSGKEAKPKEKKVVNPALISCPSETNLKLDSFCSESMPPRGEGTVRGKVSELKLPRVTTSRKGLTCNGRGGDIKNGTESYDDNALSCQVREPNGHDYRTSFNEEKRDSTQGRSSPRRMTLKKSSFEFDVLEQYSVIRKTSREGFSQSSAVEQISNQHDNCDVTIPLEPSGSTELKDSGSSSTIKFPPLEAAACAQDTRTFHAVRALWCVLQRERLVVHVTQSAHDLSRGSRTLANDMILRNRACSERGRGIHKEVSKQTLSEEGMLSVPSRRQNFRSW